jgi:hypothetical protein
MTHTPDGWVVVKFKDDLKIFCSWGGGYLTGDSWRLNSKVRTVDMGEDGYYVINESGSRYDLSPNGHGRITACNWAILNDFINRGVVQLNEAEGKRELELMLDKPS